jgi:hypothetical protein
MSLIPLNMRTVANFSDSTSTFIVHLTLIPHGHKNNFLAIYIDTTVPDCQGDCVAAGIYKFGEWNDLELGSVSILWTGDSQPTVYHQNQYILNS